MKILHSIHSVNPNGGGPIEGIKRFAEVYSKLGNLVEVVCLDSEKEPFIREVPLKVHALGPGLTKYGYTRRLVSWLRQHSSDFDVVIVNGIWQYSSFGVWRALRNSATPYFVYPHGMLDPWFKRQYPLKHLKKWLYWPWAEYRVLRDAKAVLFTCEEERRLARQSFWLYRCNERVVNYGTVAPEGDPDRQREVFLKVFPELRDKRLLLFLGRIHEKKGCDLLIRAFADQARNDSNVFLVMAGPASNQLLEQLNRLAVSLKISDRMVWPGMVCGDMKWGAFHAAEAFVLASHQENFGIAVVEALACGVPVLITKSVNIYVEILQDAAGMAEEDDLAGINRLLQNWLLLPEEDKQRMRRNAKVCFNRRFDLNQSAQTLLNMIRNPETRRDLA